jgi:hypothetical protein
MKANSVTVNFSNLAEREAAAEVDSAHTQCLDLLKTLLDPITNREKRRELSEELHHAVGKLAEWGVWLGRARENADPKYATRLSNREDRLPQLWDLQLSVHVSDLRSEIDRAGHEQLSAKHRKALARDAARKIREIIDHAVVTGRAEQAQRSLRGNATPIIGRTRWDQDQHRIKEALRHIDPGCVYDEWLTVLMALHQASAGNRAGFDLAHSWSRGDLSGERQPTNYLGRADCWRKWKRLKGARLCT